MLRSAPVVTSLGLPVSFGRVMAIPPELLTAYKATAFRVSGAGGAFTLRHGHHSAEADRLLTQHGAAEWAYVTASNPGSVPMTDDENERRNRELRDHVDSLGLTWLPGEGVPVAGDWPAEESVLVLGMPLTEALELGRRFGQVAVLAGRLGGRAAVERCEAATASAPGAAPAGDST